MTKKERETQVIKIARTAADVWMVPAGEAGEMAFISRILVQAFFPHSDPKKPGWIRKNGDFTLTLKSGFEVSEDGNPKFFGLPYGTVPRLMLAWLNSEVIHNLNDEKNTQPHIIYLGKSLSDFLEKIGIGRTGGKTGGITRFKKQAEKLFHAEISVNCPGTYAGQKGIAKSDIKISDGQFFFWDTRNPEQQSLFNNYIKLSDPFYQLLINTPVPMDWRVLKVIKQSPMALDLYMWLTHRMSYLNKHVAIKWETLQQQLGGDVEDIHKFRQQVRQHLKKISTIWRGLKMDASKPDALHLYPTSALTIPTKSLP
jgi:hypothetical protein